MQRLYINNKIMDKYQNKYRIPSARLDSWDYRNNGMYFITICTQNREHLFGEIKDDKMDLNSIGRIADKCWADIPNHFEYIGLGKFIVMPNHIHGIIIIDKPELDETELSDKIELSITPVETLHATSLQSSPIDSSNEPANPINQKMSDISPKPNSISTIIRSFKSAVTKSVNLITVETLHATSLQNAMSLQPKFGWQTRFHDHIIRNHEDYIRISHYIINNPTSWEKDKFFN
jgi:putative transposase